MRVSGKRIPLLMMCAVLVLATVSTAFRYDTASAAQITSRSLTLEAGPTDGGSKGGGVVKHFFQFTLPNAGSVNVGSIKFEYCTTATGGACTMPTGVVTTSATLDNEAGATGFTMVNTTNGAPYLTRTAAAITAGQGVSYRLGTVTNPTAINASFFVRISTYASTDTTGSAIDTGTVTASTAEQIDLTGIMPESIIFCTGRSVATTAGIPDCTTATDGAIAFNDLFSPTATAYTTSQMAASTNASNGYTITVAGPTLTSGSNTIPDMDTAAVSTVGVGQFGLNLVANTTPNIVAVGSIVASANLAPASNGTNYKGNVGGDYDTDGTFKYDGTTTNLVAASDASGAGPTDSQIYTVSYIVNVSGSQVAGTYTTTLTYVCTATF